MQRPDKDGNLVADDPRAVPGRYSLPHAVAALAGLAYALPYGHPLRAALPDALAVLRRRLTDPGLLVDLDLEWTEKGTSTAVELRKAYGLPATGGADEHGLTPVGDALVLRPWYGDQEAVLLRTSALTTADDPCSDWCRDSSERAGAAVCGRCGRSWTTNSPAPSPPARTPRGRPATPRTRP
ncbi:hypothetical protein SHKM778_50650 [Streptomyces sp. KM77-8]|uniref:Uncharacterized protein n=1 Tax=Streptomyces haneummycinicus TaxID=3074435 RepID=A0AAT9HMJ9_9ACTN